MHVYLSHGCSYTSASVRPQPLDAIRAARVRTTPTQLCPQPLLLLRLFLDVTKGHARNARWGRTVARMLGPHTGPHARSARCGHMLGPHAGSARTTATDRACAE